jgi:hypothetical protein
MANVTGTPIADLILPNSLILGTPPIVLGDLAGDDLIEALGGDDVVVAANGDDKVLGGDGNDQIFTNAGRDSIEGNAGNDSISGGRNEDSIFGGEGDDLIFGNMDDDSLRGGDGNDAIYGGKGKDVIQGEGGNDTLLGDLGADVLNGGGGDDTFVIARRANDPVSASTGGPFLADADTFQDFRQNGNDLIRLDGGLTFTALEFTDDGKGNAIIRDAGVPGGAPGTGNFLALVQGKTAADLKANPQWFTTDSPLPPAPVPTSTVQFGAATFQGQEGNGVTTNATIKITRTGDTTQAGSVTFGTTGLGATATAGTDYTAVTQVVNFAPGQTEATVNVPILSDAVNDPNETVSLVLTNPVGVGVGLGTQQSAVLTILDQSQAPAGGDTLAPTAPKLLDGESIVANTAGLIGKVQASDNVGVTAFSITATNQNGVNPVVNAVTIAADGQLTLTAAGAALLSSTGNYLDVQVTAKDAAGNTSAAGAIRVFADINTAVNSATLSKIGDAADESFNGAKDTVLIGAGLYGGATITKTVTLLGNNDGIVPTTTARPNPESEINSLLSVAPAVSNVKIDGFKFSSAGGVQVQVLSNNASIQNNLFDGVTGSAISAGFAAITGITIENNRIQNTGTGFAAVDLAGVNGGTVANNTFDKIGAQAAAAPLDDGIFVDAVTGLTISGNKFTSVSGSGIEVGSGVGASTNLNIQANTIDGANKTVPLLTDGGITVNAAAHTNMGITGNRVTNAGNGSLAVIGAVVGNPITASANVFDDLAPVGAADFSIFNQTATQTVFSVGNALANGVPLGVANLGGGGVADILLTA